MYIDSKASKRRKCSFGAKIQTIIEQDNLIAEGKDPSEVRKRNRYMTHKEKVAAATSTKLKRLI